MFYLFFLVASSFDCAVFGRYYIYSTKSKGCAKVIWKGEKRNTRPVQGEIKLRNETQRGRTPVEKRELELMERKQEAEAEERRLLLQFLVFDEECPIKYMLDSTIE